MYHAKRMPGVPSGSVNTRIASTRWLLTMLLVLAGVPTLLMAGGSGEAEAAGPGAEPEPGVTGEPAPPATERLERVREISRELGFAPFDEPLLWADAPVTSLAGAEVELHDWSDQVVLLHFWATWCPSCLTEMPSIERLQQSVDPDRAAFLAVNLGEPASLVNRWLSANPFDFPIVLNPSGSVGQLYSVWAMPTTYLVGADGYIYAIRPGAHIWDDSEYPALLDELYQLTSG